MAVQHKTYTTSEFLAFANKPENADRLFELFEGEIVEKMASFTPSEIASIVGYFIRGYLMQNPIRRLTGANGSYVIDYENTFMPDVGYISKARMPERPPHECPIPPDLAVEVKSPTDSKRKMRHKAERYLSFGTRLVWLVFPEDQMLEVYAINDEDVRNIGLNGVLDGGDVLPGFTLAVKDIFAQ